jgi:hypothetical protein
MPLSIWAPTRDEFFNRSGGTLHSPMSPRTSSHSSSAEGAVHGDLPSPLEHISQEAAAYRSRVSSASRGVTQMQLNEVMRRIDLLESRRVSESASAAVASVGHEGNLVYRTYPTDSLSHRIFCSPSQGVAPNAMEAAMLPEPDGPFSPTTRHRRSLPKIRRVSNLSEPPATIPPRST